jgi:cytochrome P450 / NADPH-cytochrome P450 reductase
MTTSQPLEDRQTTPLTVDDIPGPKGLPVFGNMFDVPADHQVVTLMKVVRELGPMVRLRTPAGDRYVTSGLAMIDDLCDDERFDKLVGDGQKAVRSYGRSAGLFTSDTDDPNWSKAHNILLPNFSQQAMRDYVPMMNDIATQLMQKWERLNPGEPVDVTADMTRLTLDTIALCGFGYRFNSFYRDTLHPFVEAMYGVLGESSRRARELPIQTKLRRGASRKLAENYRYMESEVQQIIDERRRAGNVEEHKDLLSAMLTGVDKKTGQKLDDDNIVAQCQTFLIAGHETTSGLLSFAISFLIKHPDVVARAQEEVDRVLGTDTSVCVAHVPADSGPHLRQSDPQRNAAAVAHRVRVHPLPVQRRHGRAVSHAQRILNHRIHDHAPPRPERLGRRCRGVQPGPLPPRDPVADSA